MQFLLNFLALLAYSKAQYFAVYTEDGFLRLWNQSAEYQSHLYFTDKKINSLIYDPDVNCIYGGSDKNEITRFSFETNTFSQISNESKSVNEVGKINSTHLVGCYDGEISIRPINGGKSFKIFTSDQLGKLRAMKLLNQEQKILLGSEDKQTLILYCLIQNNILVNLPLGSGILAIDTLNKNFIVSECHVDYVCLHSLKSEINEFSLLKKIRLKTKIFAIKIINERFVLLGGDKIFALWNVTMNRAFGLTKTDYKVRFLEIITNETFIAALDDGSIDVWSFVPIKIFNGIRNAGKK
ncbi:unnamed protein product, partial [Brachionus calyciflorus]